MGSTLSDGVTRFNSELQAASLGAIGAIGARNDMLMTEQQRSLSGVGAAGWLRTLQGGYHSKVRCYGDSESAAILLGGYDGGLLAASQDVGALHPRL